MKAKDRKSRGSRSDVIRFEDLVPKKDVKGGRKSAVLFGTLAGQPRAENNSTDASKS